MRVKIGQNIKEIRRRRDFSQAELAEKVGVTKITIMKYEKARSEPSASIALKISRALRVDINELFKQ